MTGQWPKWIVVRRSGLAGRPTIIYTTDSHRAAAARATRERKLLPDNTDTVIYLERSWSNGNLDCPNAGEER